MMKKYLLASDFDQTLSFNDSGIALSELLEVLERGGAGKQFRQWDGGRFVDDDACDKRNLCGRQH